VDESWTKGVVFRDPLRRLLSCYLDKFTEGACSSRVHASGKCRLPGSCQRLFRGSFRRAPSACHQNPFATLNNL